MGETEFDLGVVVSFGYKIPSWMVAACRLGMLNVHPSLLPRLRGASPIARAVAGSDEATPLLPLDRADSACGVSVIRVAEAMDSGAVVAQAALRPAADDSAASLTPLLAARGAGLLADCARAAQRSAWGRGEQWPWAVQQSSLPPPPVPHPSCAGADRWSAAPKLRAADAELRWGADAGLGSPAGLVRRSRALDRAGLLVGGRLAPGAPGSGDAPWAVQLEPRREGETLKLARLSDAASEGGEPSPEHDGALAEALRREEGAPASGTLAVTGPRKHPRLWVMAGSGWVRVLEGRIAGRPKMTMPQLVRALGTRGPGHRAAVVATFDEGRDGANNSTRA